MSKLFAIILVFLFNSCSRHDDFEYKEDKAAYMDVMHCLRNNYSKTYNSANSTGPIYYSTSFYTQHAYHSEPAESAKKQIALTLF